MSEQKSVLCLINPEDQGLITEQFIAELKSNLDIKGDHIWLAEGEAVDIYLDHTSQLKTELTSLLTGKPIDFAIVPLEARRKKLLISDMDSTIIQEECIDEIAYMAGIKPKIAAITERAMRGEIEFEDALRERVMLLKGIDTDALETVITSRLHLTKGARTLVRTMAENGAYCALVSGGFTFFTDRIAKMTGFHTNKANSLEIENNKLTGHVIPPILGSAAKRTTLEQLTTTHNLSPGDTLAVGDGANDLEMIKQSGLGVAFHAKPIVNEGADASIIHSDLTALLYLQGYKKSEFILD